MENQLKLNMFRFIFGFSGLRDIYLLPMQHAPTADMQVITLSMRLSNNRIKAQS